MNTRGLVVFVRGLDVARLVPTVRRVVRGINGEVPVERVELMTDVVWDNIAAPRALATLIALYAVTAVLLGAVGLFGVMTQAVGERTYELSIRVALGAPRGSVLRTVLWDGLKIVGIGLVVGTAGAVAAGHLLASQTFGVQPSDPWVLAAVALTLVGVATVATLAPARRAGRADPMAVLRS
jgi:ABC-type antimicrobial peptide transport system permease subunit